MDPPDGRREVLPTNPPTKYYFHRTDVREVCPRNVPTKRYAQLAGSRPYVQNKRPFVSVQCTTEAISITAFTIYARRLRQKRLSSDLWIYYRQRNSKLRRIFGKCPVVRVVPRRSPKYTPGRSPIVG